MTRFQILSAMLVTAVILAAIARIWMIFDADLLLPLNPSLASLGWGILTGLAITAMSSVIYRLWPRYRNSADMYLEMVLKPLVWPDLIWLGLLPGLSEELLFRGVLLPAIGLGVGGIVISSLCFGVLHYSGSENWPYIVWATIIGGVLGGSTLISGSLLVPVVAHITTNFVSSCLWKFRQQQAQ
ncbi:MAG: CPBP family intramembrane glutamic endopeptidase [Elainellaceae cyanobacterium]